MCAKQHEEYLKLSITNSGCIIIHVNFTPILLVKECCSDRLGMYRLDKKAFDGK